MFTNDRTNQQDARRGRAIKFKIYFTFYSRTTKRLLKKRFNVGFYNFSLSQNNNNVKYTYAFVQYYKLRIRNEEKVRKNRVEMV